MEVGDVVAEYWGVRGYGTGVEEGTIEGVNRV